MCFRGSPVSCYFFGGLPFMIEYSRRNTALLASKLEFAIQKDVLLLEI